MQRVREIVWDKNVGTSPTKMFWCETSFLDAQGGGWSGAASALPCRPERPLLVARPKPSTRTCWNDSDYTIVKVTSATRFGFRRRGHESGATVRRLGRLDGRRRAERGSLPGQGLAKTVISADREDDLRKCQMTGVCPSGRRLGGNGMGLAVCIGFRAGSGSRRKGGGRTASGQAGPALPVARSAPERTRAMSAAGPGEGQ